MSSPVHQVFGPVLKVVERLPTWEYGFKTKEHNELGVRLALGQGVAFFFVAWSLANFLGTYSSAPPVSPGDVTSAQWFAVDPGLALPFLCSAPAPCSREKQPSWVKTRVSTDGTACFAIGLFQNSTWANSRRMCESVGMSIATVASASQNADVYRWYGRHTPLFISPQLADGGWRTASGDELPFTNWKDEQPPSGGGTVAALGMHRLAAQAVGVRITTAFKWLIAAFAACGVIAAHVGLARKDLRLLIAAMSIDLVGAIWCLWDLFVMATAQLSRHPPVYAIPLRLASLLWMAGLAQMVARLVKPVASATGKGHHGGLLAY